MEKPLLNKQSSTEPKRSTFALSCLPGTLTLLFCLFFFGVVGFLSLSFLTYVRYLAEADFNGKLLSDLTWLISASILCSMLALFTGFICLLEISTSRVSRSLLSLSTEAHAQEKIDIMKNSAPLIKLWMSCYHTIQVTTGHGKDRRTSTQKVVTGTFSCDLEFSGGCIDASSDLGDISGDSKIVNVVYKTTWSCGDENTRNSYKNVKRRFIDQYKNVDLYFDYYEDFLFPVDNNDVTFKRGASIFNWKTYFISSLFCCTIPYRVLLEKTTIRKKVNIHKVYYAGQSGWDGKFVNPTNGNVVIDTNNKNQIGVQNKPILKLNEIQLGNAEVLQSGGFSKDDAIVLASENLTFEDLPFLGENDVSKLLISVKGKIILRRILDAQQNKSQLPYNPETEFSNNYGNQNQGGFENKFY